MGLWPGIVRSAKQTALTFRCQGCLSQTYSMIFYEVGNILHTRPVCAQGTLSPGRGFLCKNQNGDHDMSRQNEGYAHDKLDVLGLVAEGVHTEQTADTAADGSHQKQRRLRNAPPIFLGFHLVNQHKQECGGIDHNKIDV